jgi:hypothetical protein
MIKDFIPFSLAIPTIKGNSHRDHEGYVEIIYSPPVYADDLEYEILGFYGEVSFDKKQPLESRIERLLEEEEAFLKLWDEEIGDQIFSHLMSKFDLADIKNEHRHSHHEYGLGGAF